MRPIERRKLTRRTLAFLRQRTRRVTVSRDPKRKAEALWAQRSGLAFKEIRKTLFSMATGVGRCMYCEDSEGTAIDHFWPKSQYPRRAFDWRNYLWACSYCNSNEKRDQFPLDASGAPLLIDPTTEDPLDHIVFIPDTGEFSPVDEKGVESIRVFGLWRETLERGRKNAWEALVLFIQAYFKTKRRGDTFKAAAIQRIVCDYPFSSVLWHMLEVNRMPHGNSVIPKAVRDALASCPEIESWVA